MANNDTIHEQALDWAVRVQDPAFEDWEGFTAWLERDAAHNRAYNAACAAALDAADLVAPAWAQSDTFTTPFPESSPDPAANDIADMRPGTTRRAWLGGALAASLAIVLAAWAWQVERPQVYSFQTAPGEMREVTLPGGTRIAMAGGTRLDLDHHDPRYARLDHGQAMFTVHHDADHPFRLEVGADTLEDLGTAFDVRHDVTGMSVAVSQGAVSFNPQGPDVRITPGHILEKPANSDTYTLTTIAPDQVGEWREGRLSFTNASLQQVALDLTNATGIAFSTRPGQGLRTISGSIQVKTANADPQAVGALLGLAITRQGHGWVIGTD